MLPGVRVGTFPSEGCVLSPWDRVSLRSVGVGGCGQGFPAPVGLPGSAEGLCLHTGGRPSPGGQAGHSPPKPPLPGDTEPPPWALARPPPARDLPGPRDRTGDPQSPVWVPFSPPAPSCHVSGHCAVRSHHPHRPRPLRRQQTLPRTLAGGLRAALPPQRGFGGPPPGPAPPTPRTLAAEGTFPQPAGRGLRGCLGAGAGRRDGR